MNCNRETEARRQLALADIAPIFSGIICAIYATMILLEDLLWIARMHCHFVDTLAKFWELIRGKVCTHILVHRLPSRATVVGTIAARGRYGNVHAPWVGGVQQDRVQSQAACTGIPFSALWVIVEAFDNLPGLASICRAA